MNNNNNNNNYKSRSESTPRVCQQKKRTGRIVDFAIQVKLDENEKKDKFLDLARGLKKTMEQESDGNNNCKWSTWNTLQRINKGTTICRNPRTSRKHLDSSFTKISQHIEKSPGDLKRFAVTQTPVEDH